MSDIMTMFTANMPASVFNQLFEESQTAENACPFLTLVRYPEQEEVDKWGTEAPIQDFETGFLGKNDDELRQYFRRFFSERPPSEQGMIVENWMAVLDDQSAANSTIVLHHGMKKSMWDDLHEYEPEKEIFGKGKLCEDGYIWWKWRVPFKYSYSFFIAIEHCDFEVLELSCRPEHQDSRGIVDYETCWKIICGEIRDPLGRVGGQWEKSPDA
ncbi:hypothetical protein CBS115989_7999 [Aspergillus niger]|uniref:Uncharacterized protein n=2 Tax=Aspergillus TaxID=5052 RepID=A0A370PFM6_ASPPH|nr:uncharacterized protein BO96DRAFT_495301 [Aspergillus niger CBS 101883]KAI2815000.1 hypothetical protein CBS115989_7999 [Aspergillus niger]RDH14892.1 hypothetical protein M747DRAFT_289757 [Aspergillus niger ATCC 13496]RDK40988.1 hypothetical protein M752DRAFT_277089 [Aspergillus phoenicis ATCC 13157]KAI2846771.1 hypothetical protein CBS11232_7271 [Aspergillus niger]KAI2872596.1 hypothetical protein CBS115988_7732 [Aspergillus niger]|eukprot:XP_001394687.2 hypothetical protein ANI_1_2216094 [Aspergillus niger CBS 513.88]